jgi:hypothetical protein
MAANGEAAFDALDRRWVMVFSINAICALEDEFDKPITDIGELLSDKSKVRMSHLRSVFRAGLIEHQPDVTLGQAGAIMTDLGTEKAGEMIERTFAAAFPDAKGAGDKNPRKAA